MNRNQSIYKLLRIIIFVCFLCITISYAGYVLRPTGDTDACLEQIRAFHSLASNSQDAVAYGSSHGWLGFDANEFYNDTGLRTYNYSCYFQSFNTTWLFFQDSLRTQSPQIALLETGRVGDFLSGLGFEAQSYYTREIPLSDEKIDYLSQCFGGDVNSYLSYAFPLESFHSNWKNLNVNSFYENSRENEFINASGQNVSYAAFPIRHELVGADMLPDNPDAEEIKKLNEYEGGEVGQVDIPDNCLKLLDDICATCKKNGIILVLYTVPYAGDFNYSDALKEFADNNDCYYVNLFEHLEEMNFDSMTDFCDADHLNANGAKKVSIFLADYINGKNIINASQP